MDKLEAAGLYGNGLVPVDSPELIARYNAGLVALGIAPTQLSRIRVDGVGWSPEVAAEKDDPYYLSHGDANPLGIILTPDQFNKPVYVPYFSFQRQLMREHFQQHAREIADLTARVGLQIELEHGLSHHRTPLDLLLLQETVVRTSGGDDLMEEFSEQRDLIRKFSSNGDDWFDADLRRAIIDSAKQHGDLRSHNLNISNWQFTKTEFFHTRAFGGVFVLRGLLTFQQIIIYEDPNLEVPHISGNVGIFALSNPGWLSLLIHEKVVGVSRENPAVHLDDVRRLQQCILAQTACTALPDLDFPALTQAQRKGLAKKFFRELGETFFDLERAELHLERAARGAAHNLSPEVERLICQPATKLPPEKQKVIRQLLSKSRPMDVWELYRYNKHFFYDQYRQWSPSQQKWAIHLIRENLES